MKLLPDPPDRQRETYSRRAGGLLSGETVAGARYRCCECGHELEIPEGIVTNLPVCPGCQGEHWELS